MKRLLLTTLLALSLGLEVSARETTDMLGRKVDVPENPKKVYAPSPYGSYALYAMDPTLLAGWIFEIDNENLPYLHPTMKTLPTIGRVFGAGESANLEILLAAKPDLILMWQHTNEFNVKEAEKLKILNAPFVYAVDESIEDYTNIFKFLGKALNREERGNKLAAYSEKTFTDVRNTVAKVPANKRPKVYYAEGLDGLSTECDDSIHVQLLKLAGDVDVHRCHTSNHKGFEKMSMETILAYNPDVMIVQEKMFYDKINTLPIWKNINAVKNNRVYLIPKAPFNWFDRPPSFMRIMGLKWLMSALYPKETKIDIKKETKEFYKLFMNVNLTDKQLQEVLHPTIEYKKKIDGATPKS
ncbi:MAG: ABC transporter substrate-binding protein [Sulfuricurvum sp.]|uniref:ABC transporter substrate-binding protein n=1 Tax=Sulfuricurvum sp. TaxID=2025608 RepID=UPI00260B0DE9|nr:ABC transporter substrate-binding protein [Sulfuricurvum sp.]MDD2830243.1 ABC transporter substrate-binding protein [Sulfuricurvum sp.]MDD4948799.1 ABC transporter substrate-binding protein [Sulfuricurvum sp.]